MSGWLCQNVLPGPKPQNNSAPEGQLFFYQFQNPSQVLSVNAVSNCPSVEAIEGGNVSYGGNSYGPGSSPPKASAEAIVLDMTQGSSSLLRDGSSAGAAVTVPPRAAQTGGRDASTPEWGPLRGPHSSALHDGGPFGMTEIRVAVALRVKIHARWKDPLLAKDARSGAPQIPYCERPLLAGTKRPWPGVRRRLMERCHGGVSQGPAAAAVPGVVDGERRGEGHYIGPDGRWREGDDGTPLERDKLGVFPKPV
jgi:hypothetical protein